MIIITGASRGVGKYLYDHYAAMGEDLMGTFKTSAAFSGLPGYYQLDVTDEEAVQDFAELLKDKAGQITLINCAGINYNAFGHKADLTKWQNVIDVNVNGTFNMIRQVLPLMRTQKFGRIINFSSVVALRATPGVSAYAASKAALWGMTKSLAVENAILNITINNINLGYSELGMISEVPEQYKQAILDQIPNKSFCSGQDILNTVEYIRNTSYLNGAAIDLNGGLQ
jgi:NAD(P)-dependent dehydrogenase (short-subunit alcohol dehydrogenase family)